MANGGEISDFGGGWLEQPRRPLGGQWPDLSLGVSVHPDPLGGTRAPPRRHFDHAALPAIIIMPTEVPRARRLVWSVMQIMLSLSAGFPCASRSGQQNHTCLQSGKLQSGKLRESRDVVFVDVDGSTTSMGSETRRCIWLRIGLLPGFRMRCGGRARCGQSGPDQAHNETSGLCGSLNLLAGLLDRVTSLARLAPVWRGNGVTDRR